MEYKFFDKKFLVLPDDEDIVGKKIFYDDNLSDLIREVEQGEFSHAATLSSIAVDDEGCCFGVGGALWVLAYYDPNYECKVAYSQGKQIQCKPADCMYDVWTDVTTPNWCSGCVYRVKPEWFVHDTAGGKFYKDHFNDTYVEFEGTEEECDAWITEHTPKTSRMTNIELAEWLAKGNGLVKWEGADVSEVYTYFILDEDSLNAEVSEDILIRAWDEKEWHRPCKVEVSDDGVTEAAE